MAPACTSDWASAGVKWPTHWLDWERLILRSVAWVSGVVGDMGSFSLVARRAGGPLCGPTVADRLPIVGCQWVDAHTAARVPEETATRD